MKFDEKEVEKFWSRVDKTPGQGPNGTCWNWTRGMKNKKHGYGGFTFKSIGQSMLTHKIAYCLANSIDLFDIPSGMVIRHLCDNPSCCNPDHLAIGTHEDNMDDMVRAGHSQKGEKNTKSKLTWDIVREIRRLWSEEGFSSNKLSEIYNISKTNIKDVVNNRIWVDENYSVVKHSKVKYSKEIAEDCRERKRNGESAKSISDRYKMKLVTLCGILRNER